MSSSSASVSRYWSRKKTLQNSNKDDFNKTRILCALNVFF